MKEENADKEQIPLPRVLWESDYPLESIPFPLVDDFEILLDNSHKPFGYHVKFVSKKSGVLAGFPWWNHVELDLYRESFTIPLNFEDFEQSWEICISEHGGFIYILEGDFDHPEKGFHSWFKVEKERYMEQWHAAIDLCKQRVKVKPAYESYESSTDV